jgi:hypothetical protein
MFERVACDEIGEPAPTATPRMARENPPKVDEGEQAEVLGALREGAQLARRERLRRGRAGAGPGTCWELAQPGRDPGQAACLDGGGGRVAGHERSR